MYILIFNDLYCQRWQLLLLFQVLKRQIDSRRSSMFKHFLILFISILWCYAADKPNIILLIADDHGSADRSSLGIHDDVKTPALDRLAKEGVSYTQAYATAPICKK